MSNSFCFVKPLFILWKYNKRNASLHSLPSGLYHTSPRSKSTCHTSQSSSDLLWDYSRAHKEHVKHSLWFVRLLVYLWKDKEVTFHCRFLHLDHIRPAPDRNQLCKYLTRSRSNTNTLILSEICSRLSQRGFKHFKTLFLIYESFTFKRKKKRDISPCFSASRRHWTRSRSGLDSV